MDANGYLTIRNCLYRSASEGHLGQQVSLQTLPKYAQLADNYTFPSPVMSIGLAAMKTPVGAASTKYMQGMSFFIVDRVQKKIIWLVCGYADATISTYEYSY